MDQKIDKKRILKAIEELPEDATAEDAMETLMELQNISSGLQENEKMSHQEVKQYFLKRRKMRQNRGGNISGKS